MILTGAMFLALHGAAQQLPYQDASRPVEQRVQDLLNRMTLEEKIAELNLMRATTPPCGPASVAAALGRF